MLDIIIDIFIFVWKIKWPTLFLAAIWATFRYVDKIQIYISIIQRIFSGISSKMERKSISNNIEGKINSFAKKTNQEVQDVLPYGVKIQWVEDKGLDYTSFIKSDQIIVKMKKHENEDRNLVVATLGYVSCGLLPRARRYVSRNIIRSIDFKMVHKVLLTNKSYSAIQYFFDEILPSEVEAVPEIGEYIERLHEIDDHGFFTSVLLVELVILGKKIPPNVESIRKRVISEVKKLINFLYLLAMAKPGEETELTLVKKEIRIGILLVAKGWKYSLGTAGYVSRFGKNLKEGCERVYVISSGPNTTLAKEVCLDIENEYKAEKVYDKHCDVLNRKGELTKGYQCMFQQTTEQAE